MALTRKDVSMLGGLSVHLVTELAVELTNKVKSIDTEASQEELAAKFDD